MRKLKLQIQLSADGFMSGLNGEMDWLEWDWDEQLRQYVNKITEPVDCILLSSVIAQGFIEAWEANAIDLQTADDFSRKMNNTPKVIFSKQLKEINWKNSVLATGELVDEVNSLKKLEGGDMIVYGGGKFVSALIQERLIDELYLFINPVALGAGMPVFRSKQALKLLSSTSFECGIVVLCYKPN